MNDELVENEAAANRGEPSGAGWRMHAVCLAMIVIASVLLGLPTLPEPFGVDQGIYAYIADRLLEGAVDHRDVFDHKPPGIHFAYAKAFFVFGRAMRSIRLLDLLAAIAAAAALYFVGCFWVSPRAGVIAGVLYVAFYTCFFDWMSRAQPEAWVNLTFIAGLAVCSRKCSRRRKESEEKEIRSANHANSANCDRHPSDSQDLQDSRKGLLASLGAGIFLGIGIWFKPTILMLAPLYLFPLINRAVARESGRLKSLGRDIALLAGGAAIVAAIVIVYYAINGAVRHLYEAVIVFNFRYHSRLELLREWRDVWRAFGHVLQPLYGLSLVAATSMFAATCPRLRSSFALGLAWLALAFATVFWQGSFARSHYVLVLPPLVFLAALAVEVGIESGHRFFISKVLREYETGGKKPFRSHIPLFATALGIVLLFANLGGLVLGRWSKYCALAFGTVSPENYYASFWLKGAPGKGGYSFQDLRMIADYLESNTTPEQTIFVWGFRPIIAWLAHRRMPTRFCFRYPLTRANDPRWWNEFFGDLDRSPPKFFVVVLDDRGRYHPETSKEALENNGALSRFLHARYELDRTMTGFEIWRGKKQ